MHCPWCGGELTLSEDGTHLECKPGGMGLSKRLEQNFRDVFELSLREPKTNSLNDRSEGWWCAGCGVRLVATAQDIFRCPSCSRTMGEFVYELVEFHPRCVCGEPKKNAPVK
jgi:predicted RNA-binding Zn-ribbon protein involved in translation (DUF1610 family)